jgi:hypothetical protein
MLKTTILLAFLVSACASDLDSSSTTSLSTESDCDDGGVKPPPSPTCTVNGETVVLDLEPANVDNDDGKVTFCHATSSPTNPFVIITTSVNACFAHEMHEHQEQGGHLDVFPTGGCAD